MEDKNKYKPTNQIRIAGGGKNLGLGRLLCQGKNKIMWVSVIFHDDIYL